MSLFGRVGDVYYDAAALRDALTAIPDACDCGDAVAHLAGRCCCYASRQSSSLGERERECRGCIAQLERLRRSIEEVSRDRHDAMRSVRPGDFSTTAQAKLLRVDNAIRKLELTLAKIDRSVETYRSTCAHEALLELKGYHVELGRRIDELNGAL